MLQQNNNNNYPCLNVSASAKEMLQKCPKGPLLFPSRLDLGFGDLPLVRGLRAWALFSKNRRKAGGLVGGIQAPAVPPAAGQDNSPSCPRPGDVYEEWGRMGYGLPLGVNVRQAGIGALVTVATLKTSEGGGKTQTQCLLLRSEKGSCLYSAAKPGACSLGMSTGMAHTGPSSTLVGGWLRGKVGGGGGSREPPVGRRDSGPAPPVCVNRVRARSGRRWRKSCGTAAVTGRAQERTGLRREKRAREEEEEGARGVTPQEKQEERDKGGLPGDGVSSEQAPCSPRDGQGPKQDSEGANGSPRHCDDTSDKTCVPCLRRGTGGGEQVGLDGDKRSAGDARTLVDRLGHEVEEMKKAKESEIVTEKREGLIRLKSGQSSREERDEVTEEPRETWAALQPQTSQCECFCSERGEEVDSQKGESDFAKGDVRMHTEDCDSINDDPDINSDFTARHSGDSKATGEALSLTCSAVKSTPKHPQETVNPRMGSIDLEQGNETEHESANSECPEDAGKSNVSCCPKEDTFPLSSHCPPHSPVPHSPCFKTTEPSSPLEGSTSTVEQENNATEDKLYSNKREPTGESNSGVLETAESDQKPAELDNTFLPQALNSGNDMCYVENVASPVIDSFSGTGSELNEDTQSVAEKDRGPSTNSIENQFGNSTDRQVQEQSNRAHPHQIKVHGRGDASVFDTAVGISNTTGEQDKKATEEGECSGTELYNLTDNEKGDEASREYRGEQNAKLQEGENLAWRQKTAESKREAIRRKESNEALQDGAIKAHVKNERDIGERLNEFTSESVRQESAQHAWRTERFPEDIGKAGEREQAKNREAMMSCSPLNSVPCSSFFQTPTSSTTADISCAVVNEETSGPLSQNPLSCTTATNATNSARRLDPSTSHAPSPANPAPPLPPLGAMATTGLPRLEVGVATVTERKLEGGSERGNEGDSLAALLASAGEEERGQEDGDGRDKVWSNTVATESGDQDRGRQEVEEEEEEDEFGVFMQAEGDPAWCNKGFAMSAPVPCGKRGSVALGNHVITDETSHWTSSWVDGSSHQSQDTWTAFPQDSLGGGKGQEDTSGQWWPVEERDTPSTYQNLSAVFAEAFPSLPVPHSCDPDAVPTLTQLLRDEPDSTRATQDQGLLDSFHDLNKMIDQRYKRATGVSRDLLLQCLHLGNSYPDDKTSPSKANHRLSPGLPSSNQHAQSTTAAKRRLSYDYNRNVME